MLKESRGTRRSLALRLAVFACPLILTLPASAAITVGGDPGEVSPADPATWTSSTTGNIGTNAGKTGTLTVDNGSQLLCSTGTLGVNPASAGAVTVTGAGSNWTSQALNIGGQGSGSLTIENGGKVNSAWASISPLGPGAQVVVTGAGSAWTNTTELRVGQWTGSPATLAVQDGGVVNVGSLYASPDCLIGNGTINVGGLVSDIDLAFDATHGRQQALPFGSGGVLNLNITGTQALGVGYRGLGTMTIAGGRRVPSVTGYVGYQPGSIGEVTVTGTSSMWDIYSGGLYVGNLGAGTLTIINGGKVSSGGGTMSWSYVGYASVGRVTVSGAGSTWTNYGYLHVGEAGTGTLTVADGGNVSSRDGSDIGYSYGGVGQVTVTGIGSTWADHAGALRLGYSGGTGTLTIADGGKVTTPSLSISSASSVKLHVSGDNMLVLGDASIAGTVANAGKINFYAGSSLPSGTYSPISDLSNRTMTWSGSGTYNAFGGLWDNTAKTFTVAAALAASAGDSAPVASGQRLTITDATGTQHIGVSFGTVLDGATFSATPMTAGELTSLTLATGQSVVSAWDFTTNLAGSTVLLSFDVGPDASNLQAWHYASGVWTPVATDLTYSSGIASFTVNSFSGYAVTAAVPEPTTLSLLALSTLALLRRRQGRRPMTSA